MDRDFTPDSDASSRRGGWVAVSLIAAIAIIALILAALAYGRAAPAVGHWQNMAFNFTDKYFIHDFAN
jgi:hypothetical protein